MRGAARILYVTRTTLPSHEGGSIQVMRMCEALALAGHRVTLWVAAGGVPAGAPTINADPFAFYGVERRFRVVRGRERVLRWPTPLDFKRRFARAVARARPDFVLAEDDALRFGLDRLAVPVVLDVHAPLGADAPLLRVLLRSASLHRLVFGCEALRQATRSRFEFPDGLALTLPTGATVDAELSPPPAGARLRVGYVRSLLTRECAQRVLELARRCPELDFEIVGRPAEASAPSALPVAGQQNLTVHGPLDPADARRTLAGFDLLLGPLEAGASATPGDGFGVPPPDLFDAMAAGRPVVSTDLRCVREVVRHDVDGWLCPPGEIDAWVEALARLAGDAALRARLGTAARERIATDYSTRGRAEQIVKSLG